MASPPPPPEVSVLMPCRNALPWLPDAVCSVLAQRGVALELLAVDDGSSDGSREWLQACEAALAQRRAGDATEQAAAPPCAAYDAVVEDALAGRLAWETCAPASPADVAARASPGVTLRVFTVRSAGPSGQGLALNTALAAAQAALIGEMESDDVRPPHAFATLRIALRAHADWDAACSGVALGGWERPGMQRWVDWQNGVGRDGPKQLAASRFIEIPALRAAGLYRRAALQRVAQSAGGAAYRDLWQLPCGALLDAAVATPAATPPPLPGWWPVDSDFFGRFFAAGLVLGKVPAALYVWRQYPAQSTRTHARCGLERLRACKVHFLAAPGGPAAAAASPSGAAIVQLWGSGASLEAWATDLAAAGVRLHTLRWRPGEPAPAAADAGGAVVIARLWAFGMEKARRRVRATAPGGFDEGGTDWFIGS